MPGDEPQICSAGPLIRVHGQALSGGKCDYAAGGSRQYVLVPSRTTLQLNTPMKPSLPVRSPIRALGAALFDIGLRVRDEYGELVLNQRDYGLRMHATERPGGLTLHCHISVIESGFVPGALGLFNEMALEGYPVVAVGASRGRVSCEFNWFHPEGVEWRISADRCQGLVDRVVGARAPASVTVRPSTRRAAAFRRAA